MEYKKIIEKTKKFLFFDLENAILNNLTRISFYLILLFSTLQLLFFVIWKNFLETKDFITLLWAILAFWYWYKKYERDKELEIIDKYAKKYNEIKKNYSNSGKKEDLDIYFNKLFNLLREEYYLYDKNYITEDLWILWKAFIYNNIEKLLITIWDNTDYIAILYKNIINEELKVKYTWFNNFINEITDEIYNDTLERISFIFNNKKDTVEDYIDEYNEIINEIINEIKNKNINKNGNINKYLGKNDDKNLKKIFESGIYVITIIKTLKK